MEFEFAGELYEWRGPAPHFFVRVPDAHGELLLEEMRSLTYGWGMIPVTAAIGGSEWDTSLFPKDGGYLVPVRADVRRAEQLDAGDQPLIEFSIRMERARPGRRPRSRR